MTPEQFVHESLERALFDELVTFPAARLAAYELDPEDRAFLATGGLPAWASPHLRFGPVGGVFGPRLSEWTARDLGSPASPEEAELIVIGVDARERPICLREGGSGVFEVDGGPRLVNSSVARLAETLLHFEGMVDRSIQVLGVDAAKGRQVPSELRREFLRKLRVIDPPAAEPGRFWPRWAAAISEG